MTILQTAFNELRKEKNKNTARQTVLRLMPDSEQTDELRAEAVALTKAQGELAERFTPALEAVEAEQNTNNDKGGEGAERRALIERTSFEPYLDASLHGRALDGAEAELNAAVGAVAGHGGVPVPWEVLAGCRAPVEARADATTALPTDGNQTIEEQYVSRLFANSAMEFLLTRNVMLPAGSVSIPVVTAGPGAMYAAGSVVVDAGSATVEFKTADPTRLQASVVLRAADIQRSPGLVTAIQNDLAESTRTAADKKVIDQLFTDLTDATDATATISYSNFVGTLAGGVDGKAANGLGQIRALLGVDTYKIAAGKISANGDASAIDYAAGRAGGIMTSSNMPAKSGALQTGLLAKTGAPGSVASVFFGSGELLNDPWTLSNKGERRLTLLSFHQALTLRTDGFAEASFKLS